jgi:hypothetical protein
VLSPQDKEEEEDALLAAHEAKTVESRRSIFAGSCGTGLGTEEEKEEANRDVGRLGSSNGTHEKMSRCHDDEDAESGETFSSALTGEKRRSAETRQLLLHGAGGVRAGTVLTLADVLPSSSFAKCLVASIFLVVAWLFASES